MVTVNNVPWVIGGAVNPEKVHSYDAKANKWVEQHSLEKPTAADHSVVAWNVSNSS